MEWDLGSPVLDQGVNQWEVISYEEVYLVTEKFEEMVTCVSQLLSAGCRTSSIQVRVTNIRKYSIIPVNVGKGHKYDVN